MIKPGFLIMLGTLNIVFGFYFPSILCATSGLFCLCMGIYGLFEEQDNGPKDGDKEGHL